MSVHLVNRDCTKAHISQSLDEILASRESALRFRVQLFRCHVHEGQAVPRKCRLVFRVRDQRAGDRGARSADHFARLHALGL